MKMQTLEKINEISINMMREPENIQELLNIHKEHLKELKGRDRIFKGAYREIELIEEWAKKNNVDLTKIR